MPSKPRNHGTITYGELDLQARAIAALLQRERLAGERVVLFYEAGLEFTAALFGCFYAGAVAIPLYPPKRKQSLVHVGAICEDAQPRAILSTSSLAGSISRFGADSTVMSGLRWLLTDEIQLDDRWAERAVDDRSPAFLQYTSGSTGDPRGVIVTHENLRRNQDAIQAAFGVDESSVIVSWLPVYHDMGLIGCVLHPIFAGAVSLLMPSAGFLQRPLAWLQAVSRYKATVSGGPNFAYDMCVDRVTPEERKGLDLSSWKVAFNGAEPVRLETLQRFARAYEPYGFCIDSLRPCYGLAEATLFVSGQRDQRAPEVCYISRSALEGGKVLNPRRTGPIRIRLLSSRVEAGIRIRPFQLSMWRAASKRRPVPSERSGFPARA